MARGPKYLSQGRIVFGNSLIKLIDGSERMPFSMAPAALPSHLPAHPPAQLGESPVVVRNL